MNENAFKNALKSAGSSVLEEIPILNQLINGIKGYKEHQEKKQLNLFLEDLNQKINKIEYQDKLEWYQNTIEGKQFLKKVISFVFDLSNEDKIKYFSNAVINAVKMESDVKRIKYLESLNNLSKPALFVLAVEHRRQNELGDRRNNEVFLPYLIKKVIEEDNSYDGFLVESCVKELYNEGIFSHIQEFSPGSYNIKSGYSKSTSSYNSNTKKFVEFLLDP